MGEEYIRGTRSSSAPQARQAEELEHRDGGHATSIISQNMTGYTPLLLSTRSLPARGNASVRQATMQIMQQTHGNRAVQRYVQRSAHSGNGTLPVQRSSGYLPPLTKRTGSRPQTWWQSLWRGFGDLLPKPGLDNKNVKGVDTDGNIEYVHEEMPPCLLVPAPDTRQGKEQICRDPWDWSQPVRKEWKPEPEIINNGH